MGHEHVGQTADEGVGGRGRIASTLRALAGWGLLGAVAGRWAMRTSAPGTQPDTIRGRVFEQDSPNKVISGVTVTLAPDGLTSNPVMTDAGGNYSFSVLPENPPETYTVSITVPGTHTTVPGHPTSVNVAASGTAMVFGVDFLIAED